MVNWLKRCSLLSKTSNSVPGFFIHLTNLFKKHPHKVLGNFSFREFYNNGVSFQNNNEQILLRIKWEIEYGEVRIYLRTPATVLSESYLRIEPFKSANDDKANAWKIMQECYRLIDDEIQFTKDMKLPFANGVMGTEFETQLINQE